MRSNIATSLCDMNRRLASLEEGQKHGEEAKDPDGHLMKARPATSTSDLQLQDAPQISVEARTSECSETCVADALVAANATMPIGLMSSAPAAVLVEAAPPLARVPRTAILQADQRRLLHLRRP